MHVDEFSRLKSLLQEYRVCVLASGMLTANVPQTLYESSVIQPRRIRIYLIPARPHDDGSLGSSCERPMQPIQETKTMYSKKSPYYDGKGFLRTPDSPFYDGKGILRTSDSPYYDFKGFLRFGKSMFYDKDGMLRSPGGLFKDGKGFFRW
jgi:hypothetical protein